MKYGYARVSLISQSLDLQLQVLKKHGCQTIFSEKISSRKKDRLALKKLLKKIKKGDSIICYKLDRLGRSLKELVDLITLFEEKSVRFISIADGIDTDNSNSKLLINILMCIADYERELVRERTIAGLEAAKARGVTLGRPKGRKSISDATIKKIQDLKAKGKTPTQISQLLFVSRPTIYKYC